MDVEVYRALSEPQLVGDPLIWSCILKAGVANSKLLLNDTKFQESWVLVETYLAEYKKLEQNFRSTQYDCFWGIVLNSFNNALTVH